MAEDLAQHLDTILALYAVEDWSAAGRAVACFVREVGDDLPSLQALVDLMRQEGDELERLAAGEIVVATTRYRARQIISSDQVYLQLGPYDQARVASSLSLWMRDLRLDARVSSMLSLVRPSEAPLSWRYAGCHTHGYYLYALVIP